MVALCCAARSFCFCFLAAFAPFFGLGSRIFVMSDKGELHGSGLGLEFCCVKECTLGKWMMGSLIA